MTYSGVIHNMEAKDYYAAPGLSNSQMKHLYPTPAHFLYAKELEAADPDRPTTVDMMMGTLCHLFALEPGATLPGVAIRPPGLVFNTKEGKAWRDDPIRKGVTIMHQDEHDIATAMAKAVCRHPKASRLLRRGHTEVSYFRTRDTECGPLLLKARIDFVPDGEKCLVDIKTAKSAVPEIWGAFAARARYHCQNVHYLDMHNTLVPDDPRDELLFFVVEKTPPHLVACYTLSPMFLEVARRVLDQDMETYARCATSGVWPGYSEGPVMIHPPNFLLYR